MVEWFLAQEGVFIYWCIFLFLLGGAFLLPFPEDLILITTGILIQNDLVNPAICFLIAYLTIIVGDIILYGIGFYFGTNLFKKRWFRNKVHPSKIKKIRKHLESNHMVAILLGRHLLYLRSITFLTCGAVKIRFGKYVSADMIAALISSVLMIGIGYLASENFQKIRKYLELTQIIILIIIISGVIWWYVSKKNKNIPRAEIEVEE